MDVLSVKDYLDGIILPFESVEDTLIGQEQESLKEIEPSKVTEVPKKATGRPKGRKDSYKRVRRSPQEAIKQEKSETKARRGRPPGSKDLVKRKTPANIKPKAVRPPKKPKMTEKVMKPKGRPRGSKSTKPVDPEVLRIRREHRRQKLLSGEHKKPGPKPNPNRSKMFDRYPNHLNFALSFYLLPLMSLHTPFIVHLFSYVPAPWLSGLTPLWTKTWIIHNPFSQENKEMVVEHMAFLKTELDRVGYRDPSLASKSQQNDLEAEDQSFFINHQACD